MCKSPIALSLFFSLHFRHWKIVCLFVVVALFGLLRSDLLLTSFVVLYGVYMVKQVIETSILRRPTCVCVYRAIDDDDYTVSPVSTPFVPVYDELVSISSFSIALIDRYMTNLSDTRYHQRGRENSTKSAIDIRPKYRFNYRQKADSNISIVVVAFLACATETISFVAHNHIGCLHSFMLR